MAILTGINTKLRGSVGQYTFQRLNGQTVAKEKVEKKSVPTRTQAQMIRRVRWANLVNLYRAFEGTLHPSFEGKDPKVSDYNMFMQSNIGMSPIALTKNYAVQGGCVVDAYQITRGQLPAVAVEYGAGDVPESDIEVGTLTLGQSTTVKAFSDAIIANNNGWRNGDQMSIYIARQSMDSVTGVPHVEITAIELTLNTSDSTTMVADLIDISLLGVVDGCLALSGPVNGGVAWVHSRKANGKTLVSTQYFVCNNSFASLFTTKAAFDEAIDSYGGVNQDDFLTPNIDTEYGEVNP